MSTRHPSDPVGLQAKSRAAGLSIGVNVVLLTVKVAVGLITGAVAVLASAIDSLLDLTSSLFALFGVRVGGRPPDDTHAYGHAKFESLASLAQLSMLFITVWFIGFEAWDRLESNTAPNAPVAGIAVIVFALFVDLWISRKLARVAEETGGSHALEADSLHFATDVWSNIAVIIGLIAAQFGFARGDPLAAFVVAALVLVTAVSLLREIGGTLTDRAPDPEVVQQINDVITDFPGVLDHHTLRARMLGQRIFLDVCVELDPDLTFQRAHDLSHELCNALHREVPDIADTVVHYEPAGHPEHQDEAHHAHGFDALATSDE
ncbi:MAG: cation diffusion facilitator family transporter [Nitriliruptorales bacterium]|nr:cation diffusion facilitator family transporter [Nitriliruptorales bacterium]